jgi:hypothetical protein
MNVFKRKPYLLNVSLVLGFSLVVFVCYYFSVVYNEKIRAHPAMYCYDIFWGPANSTLYITSLGDSADYLHYYHELQAKRIPVANFALHGLPTDVPVYVQGYVGKDSSLAEVVSYEEYNSKARPYFVRCYVYSPTLHAKPPPPKR